MADLAGLFFYGLFTFLCFFAGYVSLVPKDQGKDPLERKPALYVDIRDWTGMEFPVDYLAGCSNDIGVHVHPVAGDPVPGYSVYTAGICGRSGSCMDSDVRSSRQEQDQEGIEEISGGNLEYRIDLKWLRGEERDIAEKINNIGSGLNKAVDEAMRNERLKTDLITNVSHDIKTPLTSIINYVDILKRSNIADEKIRGYLDILESKAQRLKTLTEDVVEASKVSSGNITLECMDMDLRELVQQTEGEMAEKFAARNLTMVLNIPEEPAVIHVDGRRMWRVLENVSEMRRNMRCRARGSTRILFLQKIR